MPFNKPIRRIAIIGTGVIGASWSALYLARGFNVVDHPPRKGHLEVTLTHENGTLVATRIWASSQFNNVWLSPEGHVLHVDTSSNVPSARSNGFPSI